MHERVVALDALRGIAAVVVVLFHLTWLYGFQVPRAWLAVDFFFVLSGWVMAYSYEDKILRGISFKDFIIARLARLYPLYLAALVLAASPLAMKALQGKPVPDLLCAAPNLFMLPCFKSAKGVFPLNSPSWSIFSEIVVNIAWFFAVRLGFNSLRWKVGLHLFFTIVVCLMVSVLGRWLWGFDKDTVLEGLLRGCMGFSAGLLLHSCRSNRLLLYYFAAVTGAVLATLYFVATDSESWIDLSIVCLVFPVLIWWAAKFRPSILEGFQGAMLGDISYALYLLHIPLSIWFQAALHYAFGWGGGSRVLAAAGFSVFLIVSCLLSFVQFERPARRWIRAKFA